MSDHSCPVVKIKLENHPNANALSLVRIGGYQCVVRTEDWQDGQLGVYFPPDTVVPFEEPFKFLGENHLRIKARKFRGEYSYGLLIPAPDDAQEGDDYASHFGVEHYEPPTPMSTGGENICAPPGIYPKYDVENHKSPKYNHIIQEGEPVIITEKMHGCISSYTRISLPNGKTCRMQELIDQNYDGEILGYDFSLKQVVPTKVRRIYKNGLGDKWIKIKFNRRKAGRGSHFGLLKCTTNHKIFSVNRSCFIEAEQLKCGETVRLIRSELGLTPVQEQVLIGKMLGDSSCYYSDVTGCITFGHKEEHEDYLKWTEQGLGEICGNRQRGYESGYGTTMVRSRSISSAFIKNLFIDWFSSGHKEVPVSIIQKLGPIALAFWYMDDGSLSCHGNQEDRVSFATNNFSEASIDNLRLALNKFDINSVKYYASGWRIRLNADDAEKLFLIIAPYIPPIMQYKLPKRYRGSPGWLPSLKNIYKPTCVDQEIIDIQSIEGKKQRYDMETETHNYFASGILVHNCNSRFVFTNNQMYAGSRNNWKKYNPTNLWWMALAQNPWIEEWCKAHPDHTLYGEVFGQVQNLKYGTKKGEVRFCAFDILRDGKWLPYQETIHLKTDGGFAFFGTAMLSGMRKDLGWVPILYVGPFKEELALKLAEEDSSIVGADHHREGVVIRPVEDRWDGQLGRVQLKIVGGKYLCKT